MPMPVDVKAKKPERDLRSELDLRGVTRHAVLFARQPAKAAFLNIAIPQYTDVFLTSAIRLR